MAENIKPDYSKYNQEKFTTPDSHMAKINSGNQGRVMPYQPGASMPKMPTDLSQEKKNSGGN